MTRLTPLLLMTWLITAASSAAFAQDDVKQSQADPKQPSQADLKAMGQTTSKGTVVSVTRTTLVIRTDDGQYRLFVQDSDTTRPNSIPQRSSVSVTSRPGDINEAPVATTVLVVAMPPPAAAAPAAGAAAGGEQLPRGQAPTDEPVPQSVKKLESDIKRQTARYKVGVLAGAVLDPELISFGAQAQLGPFFSDNVWARPSLELGFGEVTDLVGINLEGIYRVPITVHQNRWQMFLGGGPAFNFIKRGFNVENQENPENDVDFGEFNFDVGLNFTIGVQSRNGLFFEMKSTAYAVPHLRFLFGYNF